MQRYEVSPHRLQGEPSFRDLGGCETADGRRLRHGLVYRSGLLRVLTEDDRRTMAKIGFAWRLDLRSSAEQAREAHAAEYIPSPSASIDDLEGAQPDAWAHRFEDPTFTAAGMREAFLQSYRQMPLRLAPALRMLIEHIASPQGTPVLVHCTGGKDRTGFVCAMLLLVLGARYENVMADYLRSNEHAPHPRSVLDRYERFNGIKPHPEAATTVKAAYRAETEYLDCALEQVRQAWGSLDRYLRDALAVDVATKAALENVLLDPCSRQVEPGASP